MINMMYLVLTAMLALNVSRDILEALTKLNSSLEQTVSTVESKNEEIYADFDKAYAQNPTKTKPYKDQADAVRTESNELHGYLEELKEKLIEVSGGKDEETGEPKKLDSREAPANYMLNQKNGEKLKQRLETFRADMLGFAGDDEALKRSINKMFDTAPVKEGDKRIPWENANFEHYPLGAMLPFLTDLQAKVRNTEADVITRLKSNITEGDVKFTDVRAIVMPNSNYITQGERYEAEVFLAAYDATAEPEIEIDGAPTVESVENGRGIVTFEANAIGEVTWGGLIKIEQVGIGTKTYEIPKTTFTVAPQSVVISPTKMNVLYRGVDNPLEIGVPGVDPSKLRVAGPGVKQTGSGEYMANVTQIKGKEIEINVSVVETNEEGQEQSRPAGKKTFRIKGLPQAVGTIYGQSTSIRSKSAVKNATIEASFEDFPFDLPLTVNKFEIAIPGYPPETVRGSNKIPSDVKIKIDKLRPGSTVTIRNIEAVGPGGLRVRKVGNISVDVQN